MINEKTSKLLAALVAKNKPLEVEGFGAVMVRQITVGENDAIAKIAQNKDAAMSEFGLQLVIRAVVDEEGNPLFDDQDIHALRDSASTAVDKLVSAVLEVNGYKKPANGDAAKN